jgi:hypothetical protein
MKPGRARDLHQQSPFVKVAVIGHSGAGKTSWAARAPRPLIFLFEPQGLASITAANPDAIVFEVETWAEFRYLFDCVKLARVVSINGQPGLEADFNYRGVKATYDFQTLVFDSGTALSALAVAKLAGIENGTKDRLDLDTVSNLTVEKWGQYTSGIENVWSQQRALQCNTVFLFLAEDSTDDQQVKTTLPLMQGKKLPYSMGQYFNAVGLAQVRRGATGMQRIIRWESASANAATKGAPGWPSVILVTQTPGETTLGSLMLHANHGAVVAHEDHDSATFVATAAGAQTQAATPADSSGANPLDESPAKPDAAPAAAPTRRRRG